MGDSVSLLAALNHFSPEFSPSLRCSLPLPLPPAPPLQQQPTLTFTSAGGRPALLEPRWILAVTLCKSRFSPSVIQVSTQSSSPQCLCQLLALHHVCSSWLSSPRGEQVRAPCCALALEMAKAETCPSRGVWKGLLPCQQRPASLSLQEAGCHPSSTGWRSLQRSLHCFQELFAGGNPHCSPSPHPWVAPSLSRARHCGCRAPWFDFAVTQIFHLYAQAVTLHTGFLPLSLWVVFSSI